MPNFEQPFPLFKDNETSLAVAYQAFKTLGWNIEFAAESAISASLPAVWKTKDFTVVCRASNGALSVMSENVNSSSFDFMGKNKKNTQKFIDAFNNAKATDELQLEENKKAIDELRSYTKEQAEVQMKQAEEVSKALNLEGSNLYVTYTIIGVNVLVFILMVLNGAGIFEANGLVHLRWGSNYKYLTLSGDWWRLITNVFIHFGIIHLLMNMYCLYSISIYLEPFLGKIRFATAYLCTGVLASIVSLWWHTDGANSAGASGAVFGMYGVFVALLTTNLVPAAMRQSLLQSIGIFIVYNLLYGLKGGVDNAAHIGGLLSGFIVGYAFVPAIKKEREGQGIKWLPMAVLALTVSIAAFYLKQNTVAEKESREVRNSLKEASYKDNKRFNKILTQFYNAEDIVYKILTDSTLSETELVKKIDGEATLAWQKVEEELKASNNYDISPSEHQKAGKLIEYIALRKKELEIIKQITVDGQSSELIQQLNDNRSASNALFESIVQKVD